MTYGVIVRVPAPIEAYRTARAEIVRVLGSMSPDGLILHVARQTDSGFEMFEVWESKDHSDRFNDEVAGPAVNQSGAPVDGPHAQFEAFVPVAVEIPQDSAM